MNCFHDIDLNRGFAGAGAKPDHKYDIIQYIGQYQAANGYPPRIQDIANGCDMPASSVRYRLGKLRDAGRVTWQPRRVRTLRVVG